MLKFKGKTSNNITLFVLKGELINSGVCKEMSVKTSVKTLSGHHAQADKGKFEAHCRASRMLVTPFRCLNFS